MNVAAHVTRGALASLLALSLLAAPSAAQPAVSFAQLSADASKARDQGRADDAIALYRRALALRPSWVEGQWYLGTLLYERDKPAEARAAFRRVLRAHADHAGAAAMVGLCAFQLREYDAALRSLVRARQLNVQATPELATVVRYHTGILLTRFGEFEAGNQLLVEVAAEGEPSPQAVEAFGLNVLRLPLLPGEVPEPDRARVALAGRAGLAMATRRMAEARPLLESLVATYGQTPNVHYVWGVFLLAEDPVRALDAFRRELVVSPSHVPARLQLAFELVKQGQAAAAQPFAEQAVALEPKQSAARLALGQVHLELGRLAAAIAEFETAVRLAPGAAQPHFLLATAYARAGRPADAERERRTFARLQKSVHPNR